MYMCCVCRDVLVCGPDVQIGGRGECRFGSAACLKKMRRTEVDGGARSPQRSSRSATGGNATERRDSIFHGMSTAFLFLTDFSEQDAPLRILIGMTECTPQMGDDVSALLDEVLRVRTQAMKARRMAFLSSSADTVRMLSIQADELDARADQLGRRAAELLALAQSLTLH